MRKGFTLIELMIAMVIIGILLSLLLPGVFQGRDYALRTKCANNLHQIAIALLAYAKDNNGKFPPDGSPGSSWGNHLYPEYLDTEEVFDCPSHSFVGSADAPDYWYQSGYTLNDNLQALIAGDYSGAHNGWENKLTIGGRVYVQPAP